MTDLHSLELVDGDAGKLHGRDRWLRWPALFAAAAAAELLGQLLPGGPARALFALPPALLLPGFVVLTLLFGRARPSDPAALAIFSVALSLAVLMLDGLLLNATGLKLSAASLGLTAFLTTALLFGIVLATGHPIVSPSGAVGAGAGTRPGFTPRTRGCAAIASIAAIAAFTALVAVHLPKPAAKPFTSLSLGAGWAGRTAPPKVHTGQVLRIPVVATSQGAGDHDYELRTSVDGVVLSTARLRLQSAGIWRGQVRVVAPAGSSLHRVVIALTSGSGAKSDDQVVLYLENNGS